MIHKKAFLITICIWSMLLMNFVYGADDDIYYYQIDLSEDEDVEIVSVLTNVINIDNIRLVRGTKDDLTEFTETELSEGLIPLSDTENTTQYGDYYQILLKGEVLDTSLNYFIVSISGQNEEGEDYTFFPTSGVIEPEFNTFTISTDDSDSTITWDEANGANAEKTDVYFVLVNDADTTSGELIGEDLSPSGTIDYTIPDTLDSGTYYVVGVMERYVSDTEIYIDKVVSDAITYTNVNSPDVVTGLTATDTGNEMVEFIWDALDQEPDQYHLEVMDENSNYSYIHVDGDQTLVSSTNYDAGEYSVKIYASNVDDDITYLGDYSESVNFTVSTPDPPTLSLSFSSDGDITNRYLTENGEEYIQKYVNDSSLSVSGTSDKNALIEIYVDDELVGSLDDKISFTYNFSDFEDGDYNISIKAYSDTGDVNQYYYDFEVDTVSPYLEVTSPQNGDTIDDTYIAVEGQTEPAATLKVNGITVEVDTLGFFDYDLLPTYSISNEVEIVVTDNANNETWYRAYLSNDTHEIIDFAFTSEKDTMYVDETQLVYGVAIDVLYEENILSSDYVIYEIVSGNDVITIDDTGLVTAIKAGTAVIKATFDLTDDETFDDEITITVIEKPVEEDVIEDSNDTDTGETTGDSSTVEIVVSTKDSDDDDESDEENNIRDDVEMDVVTVKINEGSSGQLQIRDDILFNMPTDTLNESARFEGSVLSESELPEVSNDKLQRKSDVIEIVSSGESNFDNSATLTFNIEIEEGKKEENYALYYYNEEKKEWLYIGGEFIEGVFVANINHLTKFAVFYKEDLLTMNDIAGHWAEDYIKTLVGREVVNGFSDDEGSFSYMPDKEITRAEFTKLIVTMMDYDVSTEYNASIGDYNDIPTWAMPYMQTLLNEGIIQGSIIDGKRYLNPNDKITREEIVTIMSRLYEYEVSETASFEDDDEISSWAKEHLSKMIELGVVGGYTDNTFRPKNYATRGECAKIICKIMDLIELN